MPWIILLLWSISVLCFTAEAAQYISATPGSEGRATNIALSKGETSQMLCAYLARKLKFTDRDQGECVNNAKVLSEDSETQSITVSIPVPVRDIKNLLWSRTDIGPHASAATPPKGTEQKKPTPASGAQEPAVPQSPTKLLPPVQPVAPPAKKPGAPEVAASPPGVPVPPPSPAIPESAILAPVASASAQTSLSTKAEIDKLSQERDNLKGVRDDLQTKIETREKSLREAQIALDAHRAKNGQLSMKEQVLMWWQWLSNTIIASWYRTALAWAATWLTWWYVTSVLLPLFITPVVGFFALRYLRARRTRLPVHDDTNVKMPVVDVNNPPQDELGETFQALKAGNEDLAARAVAAETEVRRLQMELMKEKRSSRISEERDSSLLEQRKAHIEALEGEVKRLKEHIITQPALVQRALQSAEGPVG